MIADFDAYYARLYADRIGGTGFGKETKIYKFERIRRGKRAAMEARPHVRILDFGVGEPDKPAPGPIIDTLAAEARDPANRGYADQGIDELKDEAARYLQSVYGVTIASPRAQILHALGAKSALTILPAAFVNAGDVVLQTVPGYTLMARHAAWFGAHVHELPLYESNGYLPDLASIPADVLKRAKALIVNYPNNPTGAVATPAFYRDVVAFAHRHGLLVVSDNAYGTVDFANERPLSLLSIDGAADVTIEVHSFSKAFNMTGWRLAFVAGPAPLMSAYAYMKDLFDSGQFRAIQKAGITALRRPEFSVAIREHYRRRCRRIVETLNAAGWPATMPGGTFFMYVRAPKAAGDTPFANAEAASEHLVREASIVTVPWDEAGPYIRFSATFEAADEADEEAVYAALGERIRALNLRF